MTGLTDLRLARGAPDAVLQKAGMAKHDPQRLKPVVTDDRTVLLAESVPVGHAVDAEVGPLPVRRGGRRSRLLARRGSDRQLSEGFTTELTHLVEGGA